MDTELRWRLVSVRSTVTRTIPWDGSSWKVEADCSRSVSPSAATGVAPAARRSARIEARSAVDRRDISHLPLDQAGAALGVGVAAGASVTPKLLCAASCQAVPFQ